MVGSSVSSREGGVKQGGGAAARFDSNESPMAILLLLRAT